MFDYHWTVWVVLCCVVWASCAYWRPGSIALALSWVIAQTVWAVTGDQVPLWLYVPMDLIVIAVIYRFKSTRLDWLIIGCFPLAWQAYTWDDIVLQWWFLWGVMVFQLLLAGPWKAARPFQISRKAGRQYVEAR